jgi:hypothetical protein
VNVPFCRPRPPVASKTTLFPSGEIVRELPDVPAVRLHREHLAARTLLDALDLML